MLNSFIILKKIIVFLFDLISIVIFILWWFPFNSLLYFLFPFSLKYLSGSNFVIDFFHCIVVRK